MRRRSAKSSPGGSSSSSFPASPTFSTGPPPARPGSCRLLTNWSFRMNRPGIRPMGTFYPEYSELFGRLLDEAAGRQVAVVGHSRPDGDCIGAQVALARVLGARGARAVCVNSDTVPRRLAYLCH